jgi:hypothetical protein
MEAEISREKFLSDIRENIELSTHKKSSVRKPAWKTMNEET